jgi:dimethylargininase
VIDLALAREQHAAYVSALQACGLDVISLPPDEDHPDAVFTQDPVVVLDGRAIVARAAAESRQGEAGALLAILAPHMQVFELESPAILDGGDVLIAEDRVYVGLSTRSNREACAQLAKLTGRSVEGIPLPDDLLHLLTGCTYLGANRLLVVESLLPSIASARFEMILVPAEEAGAANVMMVGQHAIVPAGYPHTAALVEHCGFQIHRVPIDEFEKRDGGVTCLSLLF